MQSRRFFLFYVFFFFNDTATTEIYTLSLHDALPISPRTGDGPGARGDGAGRRGAAHPGPAGANLRPGEGPQDRKSTRLNSSHSQISYAVFCLKKKNTVTPRSSTRQVRGAPDRTPRIP